MNQQAAGEPDWGDPQTLRDHFDRHGSVLGVGSVNEYMASARETRRFGRRFTYRRGKATRVGYYHRGSRRFVALNRSETAIFTHFIASEDYVRGQPGSTYRRR